MSVLGLLLLTSRLVKTPAPFFSLQVAFLSLWSSNQGRYSTSDGNYRMENRDSKVQLCSACANLGAWSSGLLRVGGEVHLPAQGGLSG
jgi:hypothetical protein